MHDHRNAGNWNPLHGWSFLFACVGTEESSMRISGGVWLLIAFLTAVVQSFFILIVGSHPVDNRIVIGFMICCALTMLFSAHLALKSVR